MNQKVFISSFILACIIALLLILSVSGSGFFSFIYQNDAEGVLVEEIKLFFILVVLPLILSVSKEKAAGFGLVDFSLFLLLSLPLSVFGALQGEVRALSLIALHIIFMILWVIVGRIKIVFLRWYYLAFFLISAVFPLCYYFVLELFEKSIAILVYLNPFWLLYKILI